MKKIDTPAWIGILICIGLLFYSVRENSKNNTRLLEARKKAAAAEKLEPERSSQAAPPGANRSETARPAAQAEEHQVSTPEFKLTFTNKGGGIKNAQLLRHHRRLHSEGDFITINESLNHPIGALSSRPEVIDDSLWQVKSRDEKSITYAADTPEKLHIEKTFRIPEGSHPYEVDMEMTIQNNSSAPLELSKTSASYVYAGGAAPQHYSEMSMQIGLFYQHRGYFYTKTVDYFKGRKFLGIGSGEQPYAVFPGETKDAQKLSYAGINNQFFATLVQAREPADGRIWADRYPVVIEGDAKKSREKQMFGCELAFGLPSKLTLDPGGQQTLAYQLYIGPKEIEILRQADATHPKSYAEGWSLIMNYDQIPIFGKIFGWAIKPLAKFLSWSLLHLEKLVGNWGLAIIVLTILVRLAMWPVYARANRVSKRAAKLAPMIEELKKKYPDDPQKLNQETFKLYNEYDANPMKGCLPSLIQLPVFLGFYRMLWGSVELRHQSFAGFVKDLTMPDHLADIPGLGIPLNILPILMAVASFIQMMMMPKTMDKTQRMIFMLMPFMFLAFCYSFASGLALYWTISNVFTIGQTWIMNKLPEPELKKKEPKQPGKKGWMERFHERIEQAQQTQQQREGNAPSAAPNANASRTPRKTAQETLPQPGQSRTKLASEKGSRHTKPKKKKRR